MTEKVGAADDQPRDERAMSEREIQLSGLSDPQETAIDEYQAVSGLALAGLAVSLVSAPLAFGHPLLWAAPAAGAVLCVLALRRIAREAPALVGRKAALTGLAVAVVFGAAAPTQWYAYGKLLDWEAQRFARQWFEMVARNEREKSFQLTDHPLVRSPLDENLVSRYAGSSEDRDQLNGYLQQRGMQALLALGEEAHARYYDSLGRSHERGGDLVRQIWAVTYEEEGEKKSFFLELSLLRLYVPDAGRAFWQLTDFAVRERGE